jgi:aromatic ring-cleaving dioxygenase
MFNYCLYIGDADINELVNWLCENVSGVVFTSRSEDSYYDMYHGDNDLWLANTVEVSDASPIYDEVTAVSFAKHEDAVMCKLRFGGTLQ